MTETIDKPINCLTVKDFSEKYPAFSQNMLRNFICRRQEHNFSKCIIQTGGKIFIDADAFFVWLESNRLEDSEVSPEA